MEAKNFASMLFRISKRAGSIMADSTIARQTPEISSQAELLYQAQQRQARNFRTNVALSWGIMLLILIYLFSGQNFLGIKTVTLDYEFMQKNIAFIARGIKDTLLVSTLDHAGDDPSIVC